MNNIVWFFVLCAQRRSVLFDCDAKCNRYCSSLAIEWIVAIVCVHANGRDEHQKSFKIGRAKAEQTFNFITQCNEQGEEKEEEEEECKQTMNLPLTTQFISLSFRCGCLSAIFPIHFFHFVFFSVAAVAANAALVLFSFAIFSTTSLAYLFDCFTM